MKKTTVLLVFILTLCVQVLFAQKQITGTVTDAADGSSLPGVSVVVVGSEKGTMTNMDGKYKIEAKEGDKLRFSFVGMNSATRTVGSSDVINVAMVAEAIEVGDVVVTANAIVREKRELGYAVTTVSGEETMKARESNVVNSLAGKVAGVRITSQSGTVGGSAKILIRGASSLAGGNQPLFVVDGVPISNSAYNGTRAEISAGGVDVGNRAGDLNPDDIESMTVLKGAAACALYGSRAKDGAIIITTKRGKASGKLKVTFNSSYRFDTPLKLPELQNEYAQGTYGTYDLRFLNGWGPKISEVQDQKFTDFKGDEVTLQAYPDNVKNFYETGKTAINSISFASGNENGDFRIGFTNHDQSGIIPHSWLEKNTVSFNAGKTFDNGFSARATANYVRTESAGRPSQGSNDPNILTSKINSLPRTVSIEDLKNNYVDEAGNQIGMDGDRTVNNPFWIINFNRFTNSVERVYGGLTVMYDPFDWLNITNRIGTDFFTEERRHVTRKGTLGALDGRFYTRDLFRREVNNDLMITLNKQFTPDIDVKLMVGHNVNQIHWRRSRTDCVGLTIDQLYTYTNATSKSPTNFQSLRRLYGVYADLSFSYKNFLFLSATGRNDWSSTLPEDNQSYFYPSVSAGLIFTELLPKNNILSYGKLRLNWANVGSDEAPYQLDFQFFPEEEYYVQYGLSGTWPHGGVIAFSGPNTLPPENLKPQNTVSYELGTELKFFNDRIGLDATYYVINTEDQILAVEVPESTGFWFKKVNVGKVSNKGFEAYLYGTPVQLSNGFRWDVGVNFAANEQTVEELAEGLDEYTLTSGWSGLQVKAEPGESFGIYGTAWQIDSASGKYIINEQTGLRELEHGQRLGDIYPSWTLGLNNSFSFKGVSLSFLIDIREGGVLYSETVGSLRGSGLAKETLENRGQVFIDEGLIDNGDGTFRENDVPVESMEDFWGHYTATANTQGNVFDASFIKLREIRIAYSLPKTVMQRLPFEGIDIGVEGRNLLILQDHIPHIDPEANFFGPSLIGEGVEFNSVPTARSIGFNLKLSF